MIDIYFCPYASTYSIDSCGFVVSFEIGKYEFANFIVFFPRIVLNILGPLNFWIILSVFNKKPVGFNGECLEFMDQFREHCYLNNI